MWSSSVGASSLCLRHRVSSSRISAQGSKHQGRVPQGEPRPCRSLSRRGVQGLYQCPQDTMDCRQTQDQLRQAGGGEACRASFATACGTQSSGQIVSLNSRGEGRVNSLHNTFSSPSPSGWAATAMAAPRLSRCSGSLTSRCLSQSEKVVGLVRGCTHHPQP